MSFPFLQPSFLSPMHTGTSPSNIHRYKNVDKQYLLEKSLVWSHPKSPFPPHLPLDGLQIVQERPEAAAAFKHHGAEAPVVHSDGVGLRLKQLWGLRGEQ